MVYQEPGAATNRHVELTRIFGGPILMHIRLPITSETRTGYWPSLEVRSMSCVMLVQAASQVPQMRAHLLRPHCTPWNCRLKVSTFTLNMSGNHKRPVVSRSKENTVRLVQVSRSQSERPIRQGH